MPSGPRILCFGEILWDSLPDGLFPGGAPFNVAFHLNQLGGNALLVSAVGRDWPGEELIRRLANSRIPARLNRTAAPTGHVQAALLPQGEVAYTITRHVAWDAIALPPAKITRGTNAIVYGALSHRTAANRVTMRRLFARHPKAWRVFDVNLRPPHTPLKRALSLARDVDLLKVNAEELDLLAGASSGTLEHKTRGLRETTGAKRVCVTMGDRGAALLIDDRWITERARPVEVASAVGAGDALLAALLVNLLTTPGKPRQALARACRLAEFVAAHASAVPSLPATRRSMARPLRYT